MKKRFWSLILTLVMVLTLIPATTYVASDDGQLMLRWPWDWNNGPIEEVNGDKYQLMNEFNGCPGNSNSAFFYYVENGVETRVTADQLTSSNTNIVKVSKDEQNVDATRLEVVDFGENVTIDYVKGGKTYSLKANVILPDVGMYSAPTASKNTYLTSFTVTDTEKTFYVVPRAGYELDKVEPMDGLQDIATVSIDSSKTYATVTVTGTPENNRWYNVRVSATDTTGDMGPINGYNCGIQIINGMATLSYCWPDYSSNTPAMPQNPWWETYMRMSPGQRWEVFFALVKDGNATGTVTKLVSSNTNVVAVNVMANGMVELSAVGMGKANLSYTDENGKVYTIPVSVELPDVGYYTSATPSANALVTDGFVVNGVGDELYLIAINGLVFDDVTLSGDFANFATVSVDSTKTLATITFTDIPDYFGDYCVYYEASNPTYGWNNRGDYWVGLINGMPHLEFVYSDDNGINTFDSMWVTPGGQTDGWINYADANGTYVIPLDELKSTDESVVKISSANDPQNPDNVKLEFVGWGTAQIVYTDANGKEYAFDVIADFDSLGVGFFTDNEMKKENYIPYKFEATNSDNVVYLISSTEYDIDNFKLVEGTDKYATIEAVNKNCAKITITDKIIDLVEYGEAIDFVVSYEMHNNADGGTWTNHDGFMLTNKMCKHEKVDTVNEKEATCTDKGYTGDEVCSVCAEVLGVGADIPAIGHAYVDVVTDATCLDDGCTTHTCKNCNDTYKDGITSALGHDYKDEVVAPDCKEDGYTVHTCTRCKDSYKDTVVPAIGHTYVDVVTDATCLDGGFTTHTCKICNDTYKDGITSALGHAYVDVVTDATCLDDGFTTHTCKICNDTYKDGITSALGHDYKAEVVVPSCTKDGYTAYTCTRCEDSYKDAVVPATGHTYVDGVCKDCGDKAVVAEKVDKVDTSKPVEEVTPVIKQEAANTTSKDITAVVDAILSDKVTTDVKEVVSDETIKEMKEELEAGKQITTEIKAEVVEEKDLDKEVVKEIKDELGEAGKVAQFLDLSVIIKSVAGDGTEKELGTLNVLSEKITFTIMVPAELVKEGREFYVIRVHDGKAEKLELTKNVDGTYSFETDRFSSYALAYDETVSTEPTPDATPETKPEPTPDVTPDTTPDTGDSTNGVIYVGFVVLAFLAFALAKKNGFITK